MMNTFPDNRPRSPGGMRAMSYGMCIALIVAGAILRFALTARSPHGLNVHVVGVILILAGVLGLVLPLLARLPRDRRRRSALADRPTAYAQTPIEPDQVVYTDGAPLVQDSRHLVRPAQPGERPDYEDRTGP
jgi:hypothetical protein